MGLLNWLFNRNGRGPVASDVVWRTVAAKFSGMRDAALATFAQHGDTAVVILVAHFRDCFDAVREWAGRQQWPGTVHVALAAELEAELSAAEARGAPFIDVIVAERHPLRSPDAQIEEAAATVRCACRLTFHTSLEDPAVKRLIGASVAHTLDQLGMGKDESLESPLIARAISRAQRQTESEVFGGLSADSAEEWLRRNLPNDG